MNKKKNIRYVVFLLSALLVLAVSTARAQENTSVSLEEAEELLAEGEPAYTLEEAEALLEEVVPLVEEATERKFDRVPELKIVGRDELLQVLVEEQAMQEYYQKREDPEGGNGMSDWAGMSSAYAAVVLGKYGILDNCLYLAPGNVRPIFHLAKVDPRHEQPILALIVAHELVHALQDQETGLARIWGVTDNDEQTAFLAVIEGQAVMVQETVGRWMGFEESAIEMSRLLAAGAVTFDDPFLEMMNQVLSAQYEQIYLGGRDFISYHYVRGGNERVWEIIARPPVKTSMINDPETYDYIKRDEIDLSSLFGGLENDLGEGDWQVQNMKVGEISLRASYTKMEAETRERIISSIDRAQAFVAADSEGAIFSISAIVVKDAAIFGEYLTTLENMTRKNVEEMGSSSLVSIDNLTFEDFDYSAADIARETSYTLHDKESGAETEMVFVRVCKGDVMLELFYFNFVLTHDDLTGIIDEVLARYEALKG